MSGRFRLVHVGVVAGLIAAGVTGVGVVRFAGATSAGTVSSFVPITPCRLFDTRPAPDNVGARKTPIGPGETFVAQVRGSNGNCTGVPSDVTAVSMNVSIVNPTSASFLTVFPAGAALPVTANLTWVARQAPTPNAVTAALSADGNIGFFNLSGTVDVIADVVGYYEPSTSGPAGPQGPQGPAGPANRISDAQIDMRRWDQDPGRPARITVGDTPFNGVAGGGFVWVSNAVGNTVSKIDPATNTVVATITGFNQPFGLAFDGSRIWVANGLGDNVVSIDPATNAVSAPVSVGISPFRIAFDGANIWVSNNGSANVTKIDVATRTPTTVGPVGSGPWGLVFDGTNMWVALNGAGQIVPINVSTNVIGAALNVAAGPHDMTFDGANLWISSVSTAVVKIALAGSPGTNTSVNFTAATYGATFDGANVWFTSNISNVIFKVNPTSNASNTYTLPVGVHTTGMFFDGKNIWVVDANAAGTVFKLLPT
jgi:YVTN family beta-propeller protein